MPLEKRYITRLLVATLVSVAIAALCPKIMADISSSIPLLIGWVFIPSGSMAPVSTVIYTCFASLLFCYLFSDFLENGVSYSAVHVLSRSVSRFSWLTKRLTSMALYLLLYISFRDTLMAVLGGVNASFNGAVFVLSVIILDYFMMLALMAAIYLFSTILNPIASYLTVMCTHLISLCLFASLDPEIARDLAVILPSAQGIYAIHGQVVPTASIELQSNMIGLGYSYVYLALLSFSLFFALRARFSKRDFL